MTVIDWNSCDAVERFPDRLMAAAIVVRQESGAFWTAMPAARGVAAPRQIHE
jgi:hypothetical protein